MVIPHKDYKRFGKRDFLVFYAVSMGVYLVDLFFKTDTSEIIRAEPILLGTAIAISAGVTAAKALFSGISNTTAKNKAAKLYAEQQAATAEHYNVSKDELFSYIEKGTPEYEIPNEYKEAVAMAKKTAGEITTAAQKGASYLDSRAKDIRASAEEVRGAAQEGLDVAKRSANATEAPGMEHLRGRVGAQSASAVSDVRDVATGSAGALSALSDVYGREAELKQNLAIENAQWRDQQQKNLENAYSRYGGAMGQVGALEGQAGNVAQNAANTRINAASTGYGIRSNAMGALAAQKEQAYNYNEVMPWKAGMSARMADFTGTNDQSMLNQNSNNQIQNNLNYNVAQQATVTGMLDSFTQLALMSGLNKKAPEAATGTSSTPGEAYDNPLNSNKYNFNPTA